MGVAGTPDEETRAAVAPDGDPALLRALVEGFEPAVVGGERRSGGGRRSVGEAHVE